MLEEFVKTQVDVHVRHNGFALHWYQENWHVIPVGRPMLEEVYCGKNLEEALQAMTQPNTARTPTDGGHSAADSLSNSATTRR